MRGGDPRAKDAKEVGEAFSMESICGVLGLTHSLGLFFYLFIGILGSLILLLKMGFDAKRFTATTAVNFLVSDLVNPNHAMSFILFWTLAYALVYIY
jgi:hypothetical protein